MNRFAGYFIAIVLALTIFPMTQYQAEGSNEGDINSPRKQMAHGVLPQDVHCRDGLELILKSRDGSAACVKPASREKLIVRGWGVSVESTMMSYNTNLTRDEEVNFQNGEITLAATLTLPAVDGPHPAVILISGSGPQNRDEEIFGFKIFRIIAEELSSNGIAVLRYDDRGVGGSTGDVFQSTLHDYASDVTAALKFLQTRSNIIPTQIGLIGHSEGGTIAPLVAVNSEDVAFVVLMAGTGVNGEELLLAQLEAILRTDGATDTAIEEAIRKHKRFFEVIRTDEGWENIKDELRQEIIEEVEKRTEQSDEVNDIDGHWEGAIMIEDKELMIMIDIWTDMLERKATIDIPQQNTFGLQLSNLTFESPKVHFEIELVKAIFDGELGENMMTGDFQQTGFSGEFHLERKPISEMERYVNTRVEQRLQVLQTPWYKSFIEYDPGPALENLTVPVLAIFGGLDVQVPAEMNREAIERVLEKGSNDDYTTIILPDANHLFQKSQTGSLSEYATLEKKFVPGFLDRLTDWILERVDTAR